MVEAPASFGAVSLVFRSCNDSVRAGELSVFEKYIRSGSQRGKHAGCGCPGRATAVGTVTVLSSMLVTPQRVFPGDPSPCSRGPLRTEEIALRYPEIPHQSLQERRDRDVTFVAQTHHQRYKSRPRKNSALQQAEMTFFKNT